jgi:hypothetical protein
MTTEGSVRDWRWGESAVWWGWKGADEWRRCVVTSKTAGPILFPAPDRNRRQQLLPPVEKRNNGADGDVWDGVKESKDVVTG